MGHSYRVAAAPTRAPDGSAGGGRLVGAETQLKRDRLGAPPALPRPGFRLREAAREALAVDREVDPPPRLPHRVETSPVHVAGLQREVRPEVLPRERDREPV